MATQANGLKQSAPAPKVIVPAKAPGIQILGQYVKEFTFTNPGAPGTLTATPDEPALNLEIGLDHTALGGDTYEVVISVTCRAAGRDAAIYDINLSFGGLFEISGMRPEDVQPILHINCPAFLFPHVRQIVGDMSRFGGFTPVWLDPVDWGGLYADRLVQQDKGSRKIQ